MDDRYLALACYGKLPCWREYLSVRADGGAASTYREWLHAGRGEWLDRASVEVTESAGEDIRTSSRASEATAWRFLFSAPGDDDVLAGFVRPSRDQQGRRFPFTTFVSFPLKLYKRDVALLPLGLEATWQALEELSRSLGEVTQRSQLDDLVESASVPPPEPLATVKSRYSGLLEGSASHLFGPGKAPLDVIDEVGRLAERASNSRGLSAPRADLPIAADAETGALDLAFWLDAMNRGFVLQRVLPATFVAAEAAGPLRRACVIFGGPLPGDYRLLFGEPDDRRGLPAPAGEVGAQPEPSTAEPPGEPAAEVPAPPPEPPDPPQPPCTYASLLARAAARKPRILSLFG